MSTKHPQKETGPRKAARQRNQIAAIAIVRAADVLRRHFSATVEPFGVTNQQYNVLRILRGALPERLPTMEIAGRMVERTPGITGLLDRLEEKGLVARERQEDDRRCCRCAITQKGLDLLAEMEGPVGEAEERAFAKLNQTDVANLVEILESVRDGND